MSDDGSKVLVQWLPLGYAIGKYLPTEETALKKRMDAYFAELDRRATTDLVGDATEHDRADGHANQFHREDDAEPGAVDAPFRSDTG